MVCRYPAPMLEGAIARRSGTTPARVAFGGPDPTSAGWWPEMRRLRPAGLPAAARGRVIFEPTFHKHAGEAVRRVAGARRGRRVRPRGVPPVATAGARLQGVAGCAPTTTCGATSPMNEHGCLAIDLIKRQRPGDGGGRCGCDGCDLTHFATPDERAARGARGVLPIVDPASTLPATVDQEPVGDELRGQDQPVRTFVANLGVIAGPSSPIRDNGRTAHRQGECLPREHPDTEWRELFIDAESSLYATYGK